MTNADESRVRSLECSAMVYRVFGIGNPYLVGDEGQLLALFERVFLLERQIALLEAGRVPLRQLVPRARRR